MEERASLYLCALTTRFFRFSESSARGGALLGSLKKLLENLNFIEIIPNDTLVIQISIIWDCGFRTL